MIVLEHVHASPTGLFKRVLTEQESDKLIMSLSWEIIFSGIHTHCPVSELMFRNK